MTPRALYIDRPGDNKAPIQPWATTRRGDCETCGEWASELVDGMCIPCRNRLKPSAVASASARAGERPR